MKPWLRRIGKASIVVIVLLLLLPLVLFTALQNDQVRALAVDRALTEVNAELPGTIEVGAVEGWLLGNATIRHVRITDARGNLAAHLDEATVDFRLLPLVTRSIVVDDIQAREATAVVRTYDDDVLNWDLVAEPDPEPTVDPFDWPVYIDNVDLSASAIAYLDETAELEEVPQALLDWRQQRIADLDDATGADELRADWGSGFTPDILQPFAEPRGPVAFWMTQLEADADMSMGGHDLQVSVGELAGRLHSDILPDGLDTSLSDIDVAIGVSTLNVWLHDLYVDGWLEGRDLRVRMTQPTLDDRVAAWEAGDPIEEPFEYLVIDPGVQSVAEAPLQWAVPDVDITAPLHLSGQLALDPQTLAVDAQIDAHNGSAPIEIGGFLSDYDADAPGYDLAIRSDEFVLHEWLPDPEMMPVETAFQVHFEGVGFEPETMAADVRLRFDDTIIDDQYEADLLFAAIGIEDGVIDGYNLGALTPYLDLLASFRFDPEGQAVARVKTTADADSDRRAAGFSDRRPQRAELDLDFDARFDPDFDDVEDLADHIDAIALSANWEFAELDVDPLQIDSSAGDTTVSVERTSQQLPHYRADYELDALIRNFQLGDYDLEHLELADNGQAQLRADRHEPLEVVERFHNDARLQLRALQSPALSIDSANITAAVGRTTGDGHRSNIELGIDVGHLHSDELTAHRLETAIDGDLGFGDGDIAIDDIHARGTAGVNTLTSDDVAIGGLESDFDIDLSLTAGAMPIERIETTLDAQLQDLVADDVAIALADTEFDGAIDIVDAEFPVAEIAGDLRADIGDLAADAWSVATVGTDFSGRLDFADSASITSPAPAELNVDATGIDGPDLAADSIDAGFDGQLQMADTDIVLHALDGNFEADVAALDAPDAGFETAGIGFDGRLQMNDGEFPLDELNAAITASVQELSTPDVAIDRVSADFDSDVEFGPGPEPTDVVRHFDVDGTASASELRPTAVDAFADSIDMSIDLGGPFDDPGGDVDIEARDLHFDGEDIERVAASLAIVEQLRRGELGVEVQRRDNEEIRAGTHFAFDPGYRAVTLFDLLLSTDRTEWTSNDDGQLRWTEERIEADDFRFASPHQSMYADGHFRPDVDQDIDAAFDLDFERLIYDLYLDRFIADIPDLAGRLDADIELGGTASTPTVDLQSSLDDFHLDDIGPFDAAAVAAYGDERLQLHRLRAHAFGEEILNAVASLPMAFAMDGHYEFFIHRHSDIELTFEPQQLRRFHQALPVLNDYGVDGLVSIDFDGSGTIAEPFLDLDAELQDFQMQGEIGDDFIDLRQLDVLTQLDYQPADAGGRGLDFSTDVVWQDEQAVEIDASTPFPFEEWLVAAAEGRDDPLVWRDEFLDIPFNFTARAPDFDLQRLPVEQLRDDNLTGFADIDVAMTGTVEHPNGHLALELREAGWSHFRDFDFDFDVHVDEQRAQFDRIHLNWGDDDIFTASGLIPLPISTILAGQPVRDLPIDFQADVHDTRLSRLSAIDYGFARVDGHFGASLSLDGTLRSPEFSADAGIYDTRLGDRSTGSLHLEVDGHDDEIAVDGFLSREDEPFLQFDGFAPVYLDLIELADGADWQADGPLHFHLDSERIDLEDVVPAHLLSNFVVDPEGLMALDADIDGTWQQVAATGSFELQDGALTLPEVGRGFENINASLDLDDDQLHVNGIELHDGPSYLELDGVVEHDQFIPGELDLSMDAEQFNLVGFGVDFPIFLSAEATAAGEVLGDPGELDIHVSGLDVVLTDEWDRALHDTDLDPDIVILDRDRPTPAAEITDEEPDEFDGLNLRTNIVIDRDAWARHPAGDINFQADLAADITGDIVAITGNVDALRGRLEFLGRRFDVQESEVIFTGSVPPNPRLQIEAHHPLDRAITQALGPPTTGSEPRVIFNISGTAEEPRLELRSDPAMNDTEILFVLMTGRPPDRTDVGREEGVANQALAAVSGVFFGLLQDELAGNVPVDVLRVEPGVAGARGGRLEVGSYLTNDLFFAYRRQFGADEDVAGNIFRLEYHFMPRWMVELLYTDRNEGELNLFWDVF